MTKQQNKNIPPAPAPTTTPAPEIKDAATSMYEDRGDIFASVDEVKAADPRHLFSVLNRAHCLSNGIAAVLRIVAGNDGVRSYYDPADQNDIHPPLTGNTVSQLLYMAATVAEMIGDDIDLIEGNVRAARLKP
jgi:hypothetical protein